MKKSIMRGFLPLGKDYPLAQSLGILKKAGFDGIQLTVGLPELNVQTPDENVKRLAQTCRNAGVEPHSIYPGVPFFEADHDKREENFEKNKRVLEIAALLGAKTILFHPGALTPAVPYDDCWKYAVEG